MASGAPRIAVLRRLSPAIISALAEFGEVLESATGKVLHGPAATDHVASAEALLVSPFDKITAEMLEAAPNLRAISSISAGLDHIDLAACRRLKIEVANAPDATTEPTADLAFGLILAAAKRLPAADQFVRRGGWRVGGDPFWGLDVHHRTLGIIGYGRIGQAIARRAQGFSMRVLYHNRRPLPAGDEGGATWGELDVVLAESDFLVLQVPLTAETRNLIGGRELSLMKPTAILINTARGGVVDEHALADALEAGTIAGAALDVFETEPNIEPRLLACPNLVVAPHIGTATLASRRAMAEQAVENLKAMLGRLAP